MKILIGGGNRFLSRETAAEAARRGHDVVCVTRGESGTLPPGVTDLRWDRRRPAPPEVHDAGPFDAVIDVARVPDHVRHLLDVVPDARWVFVSTISVYADHSDPAGPGAGRLLPPIAEDLDPMASPETYGGMKVACEQLVLDAVPTATIARPGLIVGPGDPSGRFAYWARRVPATGDVLAPGHPDAMVQVIDVRDLAAWLVTLAERPQPGTFDAVGPVQPIRELLAACLPAASLTWVDQEFLAAEGVEPWSGPDAIPLWLPRPEYDGMLAHDPQPARDAGLAARSVAETARDTLGWLESDPAATIGGISPEREAELLGRWRTGA